MKTIATFEKPEEAHLLRMRLEASGIQAFLKDENMAQLSTWRVNATGGVRLQVADDDVDAALKCLMEDNCPLFEASAPKEPDSIECCSCRALIPAGQTRCAACGWSYEANDEEVNEEIQ